MELREECQSLRAIFVLLATERALWVQTVADPRAFGRSWRAAAFSMTYRCLCQSYAFDLCLAPVSLSHSTSAGAPTEGRPYNHPDRFIT